jgi:endonuclease/exonuclease/phosphatase family metal-dependent hydrolase
MYKRFLTAVLVFVGIQVHARDPLRIVFYNTENFFDCNHDSLKSDWEFLPGGIRGWTPARFYRKAGQIARVLAVIGEDTFPDLVGLAEVENDACLKTLVSGSPLRNAGYSFVHEESEDARGVDVALLYNRFRFQLLGREVLTTLFQGEPDKKTRHLLHVWGKYDAHDSLHVFVCHFPSRLGGETESESYRRQVAKTLRSAVDSIFMRSPDANLVILGDFNDFPSNLSLSRDLHACLPVGTPLSGTLYNLMLPMEAKPGVGTNKHESEWGILDQIIVSGKICARTDGAHILNAGFLLQNDERFLGSKPFRTYEGMVYKGGYSDHLPVWFDFSF